MALHHLCIQSIILYREQNFSAQLTPENQLHFTPQAWWNTVSWRPSCLSVNTKSSCWETVQNIMLYKGQWVISAKAVWVPLPHISFFDNCILEGKQHPLKPLQIHYRRQPACTTSGQHKTDFGCRSTSLLLRGNIGINLSLTLLGTKASQPPATIHFSSPAKLSERLRHQRRLSPACFPGRNGVEKDQHPFFSLTPPGLADRRTLKMWSLTAGGETTQLPSDKTRTFSSLSAHYIWTDHEYQGCLIGTLHRLDSAFLIKCLIDLRCA